MSHEAIAVFLGLDVGKGAHYAVALDRSGSQLLSRALPQDETSLRRLLVELRQTGPVLLVVDQPATIGSFAHRGNWVATNRRASDTSMTTSSACNLSAGTSISLRPRPPRDF